MARFSIRKRGGMRMAFAALGLGFSLSAVTAGDLSNGLRGGTPATSPAVRSAPQAFEFPAETAAEATALAPENATEPDPTPEETSSTPQEAKRLLHEAFKLSQNCQKIEEYSQIIEWCQQAATLSLGMEEAKYAQNLLAWSYNRRGEMWASEAASLAQQGYQREATRLDRKALDDFTNAIRIDANRWKALHNRGVSFGLLGLHDEAVKDFSRVIELKPHYANAWYNRAEIYLENGRYSSAIRDYSEVLRLTPDDAAAVLGRARSYAQAKRFEEALLDYKTAIELDPTQPDIRVERGELNCRKGSWKLAAADFRTAIELDGDNAYAYRCAAWLMATCPETKFRNAKLALEAAERAFTLAQQHNEVDYTYLDTLAAAMANAGHFAEAQELVHEALEETPTAASRGLQHRLSLYASQNPYRLPSNNPPLVRTASATSKVQK
jgi:tetratricopeptide (TPR) repeat protein